MKCLNCEKRIRVGQGRTPVHDEDHLLPIGYVCDPCEPSFRAAAKAEADHWRFWPLEVVK